MAIIDRRRFRYSYGNWQSDVLPICVDELAGLFDMPADLREIWITIRDQKTASSRRMQIDRDDFGATLADESGRRYYLLWPVLKYLRRLYERGIKTIYVEVEYEE